MKALFIHGAQDMRLEEVDIPEPREGEVLLRIQYVGICGSDLHYYFDGKNGENLVREPFTPGHEFSGVVENDPTGEWPAGTQVTVNPARFGKPMKRIPEQPHLWPGGDYFGSAAGLPHRQGAAAEYLIVEKYMLRAIPPELSLRDAALAEPLSVALHGVSFAGKDLSEPVLVLGAGPIGLLVCAALVTKGVQHVAVGDIQQAALDRAKGLGVNKTFLIGEDTVPVSAYPTVFECSGVPSSLTQAVISAALAGVVVQVGMLPDKQINVNLAPYVSKEVQLRGSFRFAGEMDGAIQMLADNPLISKVITHVKPVSEAKEAFDIARNSAASGKVLIEF